jgi:rare lipoprotein A
MRMGLVAVSAVLFLSVSAMAAEGSADAAKAPPPAAAGPASTSGAAESGLAAVYSDRLDGHRTASGKRYDRNKLTAAHKTLPFGTKVKVVNTKNGKSVELVITDRGPKQADRVLDISPRAAHALGIGRHAMAPVTLERVD